ncbi:DUF3592 domain-containing protein [Ruminococcus sp. FC2018]|uniref:DUF3592 domain-containing protein n=1 Tax=Ruminococcus sp. FC2018 TaxID=1410617 RepID=UPI00048D7462|nr:DUF3592 domain-containing protein [Ruminococcus sp. FC2018]
MAYNDYDDALRRAEAHEQELQRQMGMQDGVSRARPAEPMKQTYMQNGGYPPQGGYTAQNYGGPYRGAQQNVYTPKFAAYKINGTPVRRDPSATKKLCTIFAVVFFMISLVLAGIMFLVVWSMRASYDRCTEEVRAVVVDNIKGSKDDNGRYSYYPVFQYEYDGQSYKKKNSIGNRPAKYQIGDVVQLHINPADPGEFYDEKQDGIVMLAVGLISGIFFIVSLIFTIAAIKIKRSMQNSMM